MISKRKRNKVMHRLCEIYYNDFRDKINLLLVSDNPKFDYNDVVEICVNLESLGYLKFFPKVPDQHTKISRENQLFVSLTDKGKSYFELKRDELHSFIKKSILTPIIVSFLTTVLLALLE